MRESRNSSPFSNPNFFGIWQQYYNAGLQTWNQWLKATTPSNAFSQWSSQYVKVLVESQEIVQQWNARWLQAMGLPTREDISRVNQQAYDAANRLDELEAQLNQLQRGAIAENHKLAADLKALRQELDRLKSYPMSKSSLN